LYKLLLSTWAYVGLFHVEAYNTINQQTTCSTIRIILTTYRTRWFRSRLSVRSPKLTILAFLVTCFLIHAEPTPALGGRRPRLAPSDFIPNSDTSPRCVEAPTGKFTHHSTAVHRRERLIRNESNKNIISSVNISKQILLLIWLMLRTPSRL
jgi:hypothetical protein